MKQNQKFRYQHHIIIQVTVALARKSPRERKHDRQYPVTAEVSRQQRQFEIMIKLLQTV